MDAVLEEGEEEQLNNSRDVINMEQIMENVKKMAVPKDLDLRRESSKRQAAFIKLRSIFNKTKIPYIMSVFDLSIVLECIVFTFLSHEYFDDWTNGIFQKVTLSILLFITVCQILIIIMHELIYLAIKQLQQRKNQSVLGKNYKS